MGSNESDSLSRQPVDDTFSTATHWYLNNSCNLHKPRYVEQPSYIQCTSTVHPRTRCKSDVDQLNVLEEYHLPYAADVTNAAWCSNFEPEIDSSSTGTVAKCYSKTRFPSKFDSINASGSDTGALAFPLRPQDSFHGIDIFRDIIDDLDNICACNLSTRSGSDNSCSSGGPEAGYGSDSMCDIARSCIRTRPSCCDYRQDQNGFRFDQSPTSRDQDELGTAAYFRTPKCIGEPASPPKTTGTSWSQNHQRRTTHVLCDMATAGKFGVDLETLSNYRQQNGVQPYTVRMSPCTAVETGNRDTPEIHPLTPFMAVSRPDFSKDFVSANGWTKNQTINLSTDTKLVYDSGEKLRPCSFTASSSLDQVISSGEEAGKAQTTCRRRLFDDRADNRNTMCKNSQHPYDSFQQSPPRTTCAISGNKDRATNPFRTPPALDFPTNAAAPMRTDRICYDTQSCGHKEERPSSSPISSSSSIFSSAAAEVGKNKTSWCRRRIFGDASCYRAQDDDYRVRKKSAAGAQRHRCNICDRVYSRPSTLREHVRSHHSSTPRPHVCVTCHRRFTQPSNLVAHQRTHTGI